MATRHQSATVTLPSDTEILITRSFEAPLALVWDTLTQPRHLLRWWGPTWCPMTACSVDFRVGGDWRYLCHDAAGMEFAWHGTYQAIEPGRSVTTTEVFEGFPDAVALNTMSLHEADGVTTITTLVRYDRKEYRDGHIDAGMERGMQETMDRLDELLDRRDEPAERYRRVAGRFTDVARRVAPDAWEQPAPCEGWTARDIVRHLVEWVPAVIGRSGVALATGPTVDTDPVGAWLALDSALQAALDDPTIAATEFDVGPPGRMSVEGAIGMIVLGDVLVHTWDLARSSGQEASVDTAIAAAMLDGMLPMDEMLRASGHYGPRVMVPDDADVVTRLIAFTGRQP